MKNFIKLAAVGLAGYFVGFYEMKYKVMKATLNRIVDKEKEKEESDKNNQGEA